MSALLICVQLNNCKLDISLSYMLDPDQLRNFLHVVDLGSQSRAARRAHVTQPALSRQMKLLEEDVGRKLFERTGRGMRLTVDGRRLEMRVRPLLTQLDNLQREFSKAPISGPLTVAVTPSVGMVWTAGVVRAFRKKYPLVNLRVVVALSGAGGEALAQGKFDIGVLYSSVESDTLETAALWEEEAFFVCKKGSAHADCVSIPMKNVLKSSLIVPSSFYGIRALLDEQARELGVALNLELEIDSVQLALELVAHGTGNIILTERALSDMAARRLVAIPIRRPRLLRSAQLASSEASLSRPTVRAFWEFVLQYVGAR